MYKVRFGMQCKNLFLGKLKNNYNIDIYKNTTLDFSKYLPT